MLLIECPWCGSRDESEFTCGGEAHIERPVDPFALNDVEWADYLFMRTNPPKERITSSGTTVPVAGAGSTSSGIR